jgi:hypothetical protein
VTGIDSRKGINIALSGCRVGVTVTGDIGCACPAASLTRKGVAGTV